jgi:pimeloyl-[acyl-carrier protein] methyl ester esterase
MSETIVMLPGWGLGPAALTPFAQAVGTACPQALVRVVPLPLGSDLDAALDALDQRLPANAWLLGWSLGGMLAVALAERRGRACPGVLTVASNACFVARDGWPTAMPVDTFDAFASQCAADPAATLKRFGLLCVQGSGAGRAVIKPLLASASHADPEGLALLAALDNRKAIAALAQPQLHVFASHDALVPPTARAALARLAPRAQVAEVEGSHALVLEAPDTLATRVSAFIKEVSHG